jgi:hypothetical protein
MSSGDVNADENGQGSSRVGEDTAPLSSVERLISGAIGLVMVAAGTVAVFKRSVEAGPTALIAIGAILFVMAVTGSGITRAKFGENEVTLAARRKIAAQAIASASPEEASAAIAVAAAYDPVAIPVSSGLVGESYARYERHVGERVRRLTNADSVTYLERFGPYLIDYVVRLPGRTIALEVKYGNPDRRIASSRLHAALGVLAASDAETLAVVTNMRLPSESVLTQLNHFASQMNKDFRVVRWIYGEDDGSLEELLRG